MNINMSGYSYQWAEDDFLPPGVIRLTATQPDDGKTYVMYHGTTWANATSIMASGFCQSADGMLGPGVYLSRDLQKASRYPIDHPEYDKVVLKVKVNVGKVAVINHQHHPFQKTWSQYGYDTAWVPPNCGMVKSGLEENCIYDPRRIQILQLIKPVQVSGQPFSYPYGAYGYMYTNDSQDLSPNLKAEEGSLSSTGVNPNVQAPSCGGFLRQAEREADTLRGGHEHRNINMSGSSYQWAEDDFLPPGVIRLSAQQPDDGKTYVMYHGTTRANAQSIRASGFRRSADGMLGPGVYLSRDLEKASRYPIGLSDDNKTVIKVKVNVGKVVVINRQNHPRQKTWSQHGYDTAWVPPNCGMVKSGLEENCVYDPSRIQILQLIGPKKVQTQPCHCGCGSRGYM
ncbi:uncharacterized protein LOC121628238 [Melanotaenia boesemani]|uniref:uncharacterized protein LOC121628238 n=1 Tax=Melanotaenia boesemani TaxID=1250792 RepID=UPI001C05D938|nr:uncharacterized protein LOC121628238 [Melanotaenia boesemani]